ncbi:MAG: hypothetical protein ABIQ32_07670 [Sphingomicrobium sp.]
MRTGLIFTAFLCAISAPAFASADYYLQIKGVAAQDGKLYLKVQSSGDLDGDGLPDDGIVRLQCAGGQVRFAEFVTSPRDIATGQASGKRTHKPVTFVKEWGPATPQLSAMKPTYDVKKVEGTGARVADGWQMLSLSGADGLCPAAEAAAGGAVKTRSNIQNN